MPLYIIIHYVWFAVMMTVVAFAVSWLLFPYVLYFARKRRIFDVPNYRKLQRRPVPLLGGVVVYGGILVPSLIVMIVWQSLPVAFMLGAMSVLLVLGILDDIYDLPPLVKFALELLVVFLVIYLNCSSINTFHGLLGIDSLSLLWSYVVSLFVGVGVINAVNLIDGVDGYSSGYTFMASILFGIIFALSGTSAMMSVAFIIAGAVIPFFLHNVFGRKSKMFIGDGGTLMIGTIFSTFLFSILKSNSSCLVLETEYNISLIAICLAILGIPVFDTLRLIIYRLLQHRSPFSADRNHLHHAFIDLGCSHLVTTLSILTLNFLIILSWFVSWVCGASLLWQVIVVVLVSIICTYGVFTFIRISQTKRTALYRRLRYWALGTHYDSRRGWIALQRFLDGVR